MTATEVARSFSSVLNRVHDGEEIEITRNGATVAVLRPPPAKKRRPTADEIQAVLDTLEPFDDEFVEHVKEARRLGGVFPDDWPRF
jgi:prevent-host-death family protein